VLPLILEYSKVNCAGRLADLARACNIGDADSSDAQLADEFIVRIREMKTEFDIPATLAALKAQDIPQIARAAQQEVRFTYHVPRYMDKTTCEAMIAKMLPG
jgi:alcohol dehydrogenase class IV